MIESLVRGALKQRLIVAVIAAVLFFFGLDAARKLSVDAFPAVTNVQVQIATEAPGRSPEEVERFATVPLEVAMTGLPGLEEMRSLNKPGLSLITLVFNDKTDVYFARQLVMERLLEVGSRLPQGITPVLGPVSTGLGEVYQYTLERPDDGDRTLTQEELMQRRIAQDWVVRPLLRSIPGVAEINSQGGYAKQYQVLVNPDRLRHFGLSIADVYQAVGRNNANAGGGVLPQYAEQYLIRGVGLVRDLDDLRAIVLREKDGVPVYVRDVGEVSLGPDMRRGVADLDGKGEAVGGIVVMRYGENALDVIARVKHRLKELESALPPGVKLVVTYDRSELIEASIKTLKHTLIEEMVVVSLIIFLFLLHVRSALIPVLTLPLGVLLAFIPMYYQGLTINIMSLGGIAVALGAMVDASIILIENIHKKLEHWQAEGKPGDRVNVIVEAMQEVGPSIFFSLLMITVSFMPVFTLEATEGRLFKPLAFTKTYSMGFAAILAITLTPALAAIFIRGKIRGEEANPLNRWLIALYSPVVRVVVRYRRTMIVAALLGIIFTIPAYLRLQSEFMPPLNEGSILYMPTSPPGMSESEAVKVLQSMDRQLKTFPEVVTVFGKAGRADTPTDPAPLSMAEIVILLKPKDQWRPGLTWEGLVKEMDATLQYPGMPNAWWMPIQTRTETLATGIRSQLGIKVYGDSVQGIEKTAVAIEKAVAKVPGTRSAYAERAAGGFFADFSVDRAEAARHGLLVQDVNDVIMSSIGGMNISETVEGRERYPINVRYAREFRDTPETMKNVLVATPSGAQIPLSQVAKLDFTTGPDMLRSESGKLVGFVFVDISDRPIAEYVADARKAVAAEVQIPSGQRIEWAGQFKYFERAKEKLTLIVPITLAMILFLLYLNTKSVVETAMVLLAVPFSLVGAIWLLYLLDYHMSVAVWVGLIALAGLDAETGVVMLLYLKIAHKRRQESGQLKTFSDLQDTIVEGAAQRIRPKLMTVLTTMIGLVPIMWSTGTGSDVMKRITAPMVGGLVTSFLIELLVYPALFALWKARDLPKEEPAAAV